MRYDKMMECLAEHQGLYPPNLSFGHLSSVFCKPQIRIRTQPYTGIGSAKINMFSKVLLWIRIGLR
jgi:hypothetical protein